MHSLFWKIFLTFWAALLLFTVGTVLSANYIMENKREAFRREPPHVLMRRHALEAQKIADEQGVKGLQSWLRRLDRHEAVPFLLLDERGEDLLGRTVPERLKRWSSRQRHEPPEHGHGTKRPRLPRVQLPNGETLRLAVDFHNITLQRALVRPRVMAVPVILAALISGIVCFLLARYLTRPLAQLHAATEAYGRGNLSLRVGPTLGRRRDEIADLAQSFDRMAGQLDCLLRSHKQLLRDVSHELRSPLARLHVALGLAQKQQNAQTRPQLARIEREAERLDELIGQLLSLARLESRDPNLTRIPLDMQALVKDVVEDARFEAHNAQRDVQLSETQTLQVAGDESLLHSAVENIVRNALRHTQENTCVELTLKRDPLREGYLLLEVRDHGPGVAPSILPHLFEPFVRADDARSRDQGGYGLGLAIAKRVVELHDGALSASNATGGGLLVSLALPLAA